MGVSVEHLQRLLQELDAKIALEEVRVAEYKKAVGAVGGRWTNVRLGQVKHLYNLIEMRQLVMLKLTFPHRTFYGQAKLVALELPNGEWILVAKGQRLPVLELTNGSYIPAPKRGGATPKGAKTVTLPRGRIWDIVEIPGADDVQSYELKTKNAIVDSAGRANDVRDIESESFKPKRALTIQTNVERMVQKAAQALNAKIVMNCDDPIMGVSVVKRIAPDRFPISQVMTYGQIPDRLVKQEPGFTRLTLHKANKRGDIHLGNSKMSRPPEPAQEAVERTTKPSGRKVLDQRGTAEVREQGPVKISGSDPKVRLTALANRSVESTGVGAATRSIGVVSRVLAPVGVIMLGREFSGAADAERTAQEVAGGLNIDNYGVGEEFTVAHGGYDYRIRVEQVSEWPYIDRLGRPDHPVPWMRRPNNKRFAFLSRKTSPI